MKRFIKGCVFVIVVLLILTIIFIVVAGKTGYGDAVAQALEKVSSGKLHLDTEGMGDLVDEVAKKSTDLFGGVNYELRDSMEYSDKYPVYERYSGTIELTGKVKNMQIDVGGCELKLVHSGEDYHIEAERVGRLQSYVKRGVLVLKATNAAEDVDTLKDSKITLFIPENETYGQIDVNLGAGKILLGQVSSKFVNMRVGAGAIEADGITAEEMKLVLGVGAATLTDITVDDFTSETGMGAMDFSGAINRSLTASCSMGSVNIVLEGSQEDYNYSFEGNLGGITIGDMDKGGLAAGDRIDNGADKNIRLECSMGGMELSFKE